MKPRASRWPALCLVALAVTACRSDARAGHPDAAAPPRVILDGPSGRSSTVDVEVARTPAAVELGLMFRDKLASHAGMLFVFPDTAEHDFWMKNTLIPLDMIFADERGVVVGIVENAEPLTTTTRSVGAPSRYVLEVNAGWSAAHGIARGDRMRFVGIPGLP